MKLALTSKDTIINYWLRLIGGVSEADVNVPDNNHKRTMATLKNLNDLIEQFPGVKIKGHNEALCLSIV